MENIDYTKLSSKGQIVVPKGIRDYLRLKTGELFLIFADKDTLILKRVKKPSDTDLEKMFAKSQKLAKEKGLKKEDLEKTIKNVRDEKNTKLFFEQLTYKDV